MQWFASPEAIVKYGRQGGCLSTASLQRHDSLPISSAMAREEMPIFRHQSPHFAHHLPTSSKIRTSNSYTKTTMSLPTHALEIDPESSLQFTITRDPAKDGSDGSSRCTMTLRHPGHTKGYLAFKVSSRFVKINGIRFEDRAGWMDLCVALLFILLSNYDALYFLIYHLFHHHFSTGKNNPTTQIPSPPQPRDRRPKLLRNRLHPPSRQRPTSPLVILRTARPIGTRSLQR